MLEDTITLSQEIDPWMMRMMIITTTINPMKIVLANWFWLMMLLIFIKGWI